MMKSLLAAIIGIDSPVRLSLPRILPPCCPGNRGEVKAAEAADAVTKDATGKTDANREGKMSPTGQNETSSVTDQKKESSPSTSTGAKSK